MFRKRLAALLASAAMALTVLGLAAGPAAAVPVCNGGRFVTVYINENYGAPSQTFCASGGNVNIPSSNQFYNSISSYVIGGASSTKVTFFTHANWDYNNGTVVCTTTSNSNLFWTAYNDLIKSIKFSAAC